MRNNIFIYFILIVLLFFSLSCNDNNSFSKERVNITIWLDAFDKEMEFLKKTAKLFEEQNREIKIKFKFIQFNNLKPTFVGQPKDSGEPDIIFLANDWIGELAEKKLIKPINGEYNDFLPLTLEGLKYNNKLYALPRSFEVIALVYNRKLIPKPPANVKQMIEIASDLQKKGIYGLMYDNKNFYYHFPWFYAYGGRLFDSKSKFIVPGKGGIDSFKFAVSLEDDYRIIPQKCNYSAMMNMFCSNQAGMIIAGPWSLGELEKNNIKYGIVPLPVLDNGKHPAPFLGIKSCAVTTLSHYPAAAQKVIEFFTSLQIQKMAMKELGVMPCMKSIYKEGKLPQQVQGFYEQAKYAISMPTTPKMKYVWQEYNWALTQSFGSASGIEKFLDDAVKNIKAEIN